ncbi:glycoside hydrolase family 3 N-terminal domain-containing protein [Cellulomonas sp. KRMCY2]|uniref:glycoside hydrolase family 3 N-terminal domain-containing protein n=1 Tax=Cellulomonas sp. KRMCY2 TaxID=1304865 RepID=UPI0004BB9838|nr:glycoside hydrolase family 3 N-terminal domain-containing protein [Cellulomonas sp. KRMCY2]
MRRPTRTHRLSRPSVAALAVIGLLAPLAVLSAGTPAAAATADLALSGVATASQSQDDGDGRFPPDNAVDGDPATRWASGNGPDEDVEFTAWLQVDLGGAAQVESITLTWEAAYATAYDLQVATSSPQDEASWTTVHTETAGDGGDDAIALAAPVEARYVRVVMLERVGFDWDPARTHWYGYSLFTLGVHGTPDQTAVLFARATTSVPAGQSAAVPVVLNAPATQDLTVRVTSGGGTAVPGTDYTPVDQVLTFPAGSTRQDVIVETVDRGPLAPVSTVDLALTEPSGGLVLGARAATTVTLSPHGDLPDVGTVVVLDDFESGVPAGYTTWGSSGPVTPVLSTVPSDRDGAPAGNHALQATVGATPVAGDWFGFTHDLAAQDWSASDGFSFWFLGTGSGGLLRYELKSGGQLFERAVVDDTAGWRLVSVPFSQLRLKGDPGSDARFDPSASTGFAVTLTDLGAGDWLIDDIGLYERVTTVEDFEGDVPIAAPGTTVGLFTWGSAGATVSLNVTEMEREGGPVGNHVLSGAYLIPSGGWGGFSHNLAAAQDWSSFQGIRFLWYASQDNRPASPTAGGDIKVELKDGGPDGEHSELWAATFKDNWSPAGSRWKLVELPFSDFTLGGYQPGDAATRSGTLDLTSAWGYALTMVPGTVDAVGYAVDDVQLYGSAVPAPTVAVAPAQEVYLVDPGDAAQVAVRVTTTDGAPLGAAVTVGYADTAGTAQAGTHYPPLTGSLTFEAGAASGSEQVVEVATLATAPVDDARSFELTLTADGAQVSSPRIVLNAVGAPYLDASLPTAQRVEDLLGRMTLAEKIGQMTQAERLGLQSPQQITDLALGSVLSGGGSVPQDNTPAGWADMVDGYQRQALSTRLQVPLIYGVDAVHGHNNVAEATIFPHNAGLGASRDPALVQAIGEVTALEVRGTGVPWTFAPCLCVSLDERWGRSYESFGEDPALVTALARAAVVGLQGEDAGDLSGPSRVLATAKHWAGDGGTRYEPALAGSGYPIDQGVTYADSVDELRRLHVDPYVPAIDAGVGSIMPSYSAVDIAGAGPVRMHENAALNNDLLKGELGFDGFLISDWEGIDKLPGGTYAEKAARAVDAGVDMAMAPYNFGAFITALTEKVADGSVSQERIDDAVRRILTQKVALGLFEQPMADRTYAGDLGSAEHRAVARQAAAASQVLLKNDGVLPLAADADLYVAGSNADDLGHQMGGWTISWQGGSGDTTQGITILEGIGEVAPDASVTYSADASAPMDGADVGIVVVGEPSYAEGIGDVGNNGRSLELPAADQAAIDAVCGAMPCAVLVVAGRPQVVSDRLPQIDALVASWLPGSEGAGVADVLFGAAPFTGRLPLSWPASVDQVPVNVGDPTYAPAYAYGWGLRTDAQRGRLEQVRDALAAGAAREALTAVLDADVWSGDALSTEPADVARAVRLLVAASAELDGAGDDVLFVQAGLVVSVVRDVAQAAVVAGATGLPADALAVTADAEHALMSGRAGEAAELLAGVAGVDLAEPATSTTQLRISPQVNHFGRPTTAVVTVRASAGVSTGTVEIEVDGTVVATGELTAGHHGGGTRAQARIELPADLAVGRHDVVAVYRGTPTVDGSTSQTQRYVVLRAAPEVRTDGTDRTVRRSDPKVVEVQVGPVAGVVPTGTVDVYANGVRAASAALRPDGTASVALPARTRTALVLVVYRGDVTFAPGMARPMVLWVR